MTTDFSDTLARVRRALKRDALDPVAAPPVVAEASIRLVFSDIGLPALFEKKAREMNLDVVGLRVEKLHAELISFLKAQRVKRLALPRGKFLDKVEVPATLRAADFDVRYWDEIAPADRATLDAGVTDVYRAVAETGSIAVRSALAVWPRVHVAIVEPKNCVADLVDLFAAATKDDAANLTIVSGPGHSEVPPGRVTRVFLLK